MLPRNIVIHVWSGTRLRVSAASDSSPSGPSRLLSHFSQEDIDSLCAQLSARLGLHLFNYDLIQADTGEWFVVDVNHFPGYDKIPGFEVPFCDMLHKMKPST